MGLTTAWLRRRLAGVRGATPAARVVLWTIRVCLRYRVTGLAAEAGFFLLLSLPPFVLGVFGAVGYVGKLVGHDAVASLTTAVTEYAGHVFAEGRRREGRRADRRRCLCRGRLDLLSVGFLLALWSGSRALNVFLDTISIMYGQSGKRGSSVLAR